jgi:hypothetical protein
LQSINQLLQQARRPSTKKSYNSKVDKFQDFCGRVQDEAGTPRLSSMPASQTTILAFIGYLASLGKIRSSSLQPYLSAINSLHADFGFPKPAQGHWISLARKGFGEIEGSLNQAPTKIQALICLMKMLTSSMTPSRSKSRPGISSGLKQHRSLELHQQRTTHNGFFNNYRKNGNASAVTTSTRARIGSFKTNHRQPLK